MRDLSRQHMICEGKLGLALDFFHGDARCPRNSNHVRWVYCSNQPRQYPSCYSSFQVRTIRCCSRGGKEKLQLPSNLVLINISCTTFRDLVYVYCFITLDVDNPGCPKFGRNKQYLQKKFSTVLSSLDTLRLLSTFSSFSYLQRISDVL
jgi:hypothetical protein